MSATKLVKVFYCYSNSVRDEEMRQKLENHLRGLERQGVITKWHKGMISPGKDWEVENDNQLKTADIILVLISSDFIASDYHWEVVIKKAMQQHRARKSRVIPILLRPVLNTWKLALDNLQALPKGEIPVTSWKPYDNAFVNIAEGIKEAAEELNDPTFHIKKYSRQASPVVISIFKLIGNACVYIIRGFWNLLFKYPTYRRYRRVNKIPLRLILIFIAFLVFISSTYQQYDVLEAPSSNLPGSFLPKPNSNPELSQKLNPTGWIWLGMVKNSSGGVFIKKTLINKPKNVLESPSITSINVPSPGTIVTVRYKVNLKKGKSSSSTKIDVLQRGDKLVILKVEPVGKPNRNATYIRLMAQIRKCNNFCNN
ncbi:toll/interleukin-1 receptor domain-containing protein [Nostoc sp. FACHB-152]|uniref:toll/interleukin-1 receptor domain-containing protein n=1 Tax=unclassified Nostoc TaxID=2593658 RepID=UPI0016879842|nr:MULTISPECIES: toll/interleukin-1 receptor domain-containing protein [unclassified Nostoc]MBD2451418.1 toll/interleukin-1 receptor domain-containing protein [Nostoc sp. FACHB-152]MBD2469376.1 toll/interleukin-1 receptor domain-containing protein [Nostoc sp. FACHB-145]